MSRLRTLIVGFGRIAAGYADDPRTAKHFRFATHAQALRAHPEFEWDAVVDPSESARELAGGRWNVTHVAPTIASLDSGYRPDVVVLATPPEQRLEALHSLPAIRALIVEKPLGATAAAGREFLAECVRRGIAVQVNYWRRADPLTRRLSLGGLHHYIGGFQAATGVYGGGLRNNGSHLIDMIRLLLGEPAAVQSLGGGAFCLHGRTQTTVSAIDFDRYREVGLTVWGQRGVFELANEGLTTRCYSFQDHRAMQRAREIAFDAPETLAPTAGEALFHLYDNVSRHLRNGDALWSPGDSALRTEQVLDATEESERRGGARVELQWTC